MLKKNFGFILILGFGLVYFGLKMYHNYKLNTYFHAPKVGDIYVVKFDEKFAPLYLDSLTKDTLCFFSHKYDYSNSVPNYTEIIADSFNTKFHYIYGKEVVEGFYEKGILIKIYRNANKD